MKVGRLYQRSNVTIVAGSKFKCQRLIDLWKIDKKWQSESPRRLYWEIVALRPTYDMSKCIKNMTQPLISVYVEDKT